MFTQLQQQIQQLATRYGLQLGANTNATDLIATIVFDPARGADVPKTRFAFLFPNAKSAVIQARLKPGLSESERRDAIALVKRAVAMDRWRLDFDAKYTVTGAPVVIDGLSRTLTDALWLLLLAAVLVMAAVLALIFRSRLRLLPLVVALAATACVFGAMAVLGIQLTMASIAVLPVLVGLAVDYAIQYQARVDEERERGLAAREAAARHGPLPPLDPAAATAAAARRAARVGAPTIATAALATAVGFLVLLAPVVGSPVPMVRGFALLLVLGIAIAFALALTAGTAALVAIRPGPREGALARSGRGAADLLRPAGRWFARPARLLRGAGRRVLGLSIRRPGRVLAVAFVLALGGWVLDSQTEVTSDLNQLVPQNLQAVRDVNELQRTTGISGEIDVLVEAPDLTEPEVVQWMREYKDGLLKRYGYSTTRGCGQVALCPALSLPDLFRNPQAASSRDRIQQLLEAVPAYFSQAVISKDRRTAIMAFGIKLLPFDEQQRVIDEMRRRLDPPRGVRAEIAGLPVLAAQAHRDLSDPWRRMGLLLAGLAAVGLALWLLGRRRPGALLALVPIALATGWSALVLFATRVPLNPMSATLGVLVIAISTEFSVLLSARYRQERAGGLAAAGGARAHLPLDRRGRARLRRHRDRRLRRSGGLEHHDAARVRHRHRRRPGGVAARRAGGAAGRADAGRAPLRHLRARRAATAAPVLARARPGARRMSTGGPFGRGGERESDRQPAADRGKGEAKRRPPPPKRRQATPTSRSTWVFGVFSVIVLGWIFINAIQTEGPGSRGIPDGQQLPPFAVPLATANVKEETDANVDVRRACGVRRPDVINSCDLAKDGPVVLAFFVSRSRDCRRQVDVLNAMRTRHPDVNFAAVAIRGDRDDVRRQIRDQRWRIPIGYDHDGALSTAYAVAVCPTITFARRGGKVTHTSFKLLDERAVAAELARAGG